MPRAPTRWPRRQRAAPSSCLAAPSAARSGDGQILVHAGHVVAGVVADDRVVALAQPECEALRLPGLQVAGLADVAPLRNPRALAELGCRLARVDDHELMRHLAGVLHLEHDLAGLE